MSEPTLNQTLWLVRDAETILAAIDRAWWKLVKSPSAFERLQDALDDEADEVEYHRR